MVSLLVGHLAYLQCIDASGKGYAEPGARIEYVPYERLCQNLDCACALETENAIITS